MDARDQFKRGLLWFGSATAVMRLFDLGSTLVVLALLTREEMGLSALVWSVAVVLEAFNGIGVGAALVQTREVTKSELDSLFWFAVGVGVTSALVMTATSPVVAAFYDEPILVPMLAVASIKMVLVGAALVPVQLLARNLQFAHNGALQTMATGMSALTRIALAFAGTGAWALVIGDASRGLYLLVGVFGTTAFRPKLRFAFSEVRRFVSFGWRAASASILFHAYRNIDYLVVGKVLGTETLGIYRVAFEVAMSPTEAIIQVVNRVAFPVFSRIASDGHKLVDAFLAIARYTVFVTGPVAVFLYFGASDVIRTITHERWLAAVPAVQILCWGGLLRSLAQIFPQLFNAAGRPTLGIVDSIVTFIALGGTFTGGAVLFGDRYGIAAVCYGWLVCYPVLLVVLLVLARLAVPMTPFAYVRNLASGAAALVVVAVVVWVASLGLARVDSPLVSMLALGAVAALAIAGYARWVLGLSPGDLLPSRAATVVASDDNQG